MLNKIKNLIIQKTNEIQATVASPIVPIVEQTQEQQVIHNFTAFISEMKAHDGFPKKGITFLEDILKTIQEMDSQTIGLQEQATIRKIVEKDIPQMIELYLSLPKAHAVSFILENGKTSKDTLIDKLSSQAKQVSHIWDNAVVEKTNLLLKKQKATTQPAAIKKDFFDM